MTTQKEFGDFQTPSPLADEIVRLVEEVFGVPSRVVEPTAGKGSFLEAACSKWGAASTYEGYEINPAYIQEASRRLTGRKVALRQQDFFEADWPAILRGRGTDKLLVIGNPPWVTNSALGTLGSSNLPQKSNFQGLRGFDAKTGKSNFDIAEWMLIKIIESLDTHGAMAMLCKTMTARKVLFHFWKRHENLADSRLFLIDAKAHFGVSVDACLFYVSRGPDARSNASVYSCLSTRKKMCGFGLVDGKLVSNVETYMRYRDLDGGAPYIWRSGVKHDAAAVMELTPVNGHYQNSLGEEVLIEPEYVYPLLKSSDLANEKLTPRYHVLVTQKKTGDPTNSIQDRAPRTWDYLQSHADILDGRKSSIYKGRPRFSVFGIGSYSFSLWKVAISGLYKSFRFIVVPPIEGRPVMLDDTCYFVPCNSEKESRLIHELLGSEPCQEFLGSLVFQDSKRPITAEVLRRISLAAIATRLGRFAELSRFVSLQAYPQSGSEQQLCLAMETGQEYRTRKGIKR